MLDKDPENIFLIRFYLLKYYILFIDFKIGESYYGKPTKIALW